MYIVNPLSLSQMFTFEVVNDVCSVSVSVLTWKDKQFEWSYILHQHQRETRSYQNGFIFWKVSTDGGIGLSRKSVANFPLYWGYIWPWKDAKTHTRVSRNTHKFQKWGEVKGPFLVALGFPYYLGSYYCESERGDLDGDKVKLGDGEKLGDNGDESGWGHLGSRTGSSRYHSCQCFRHTRYCLQKYFYLHFF